MMIIMTDTRNYQNDFYFFCDYCGECKPEVPGANFRNEPLYYQQGRKMKQVTMCLDCASLPEYAPQYKMLRVGQLLKYLMLMEVFWKLSEKKQLRILLQQHQSDLKML
jgi:hypothetical protein